MWVRSHGFPRRFLGSPTQMQQGFKIQLPMAGSYQTWNWEGLFLVTLPTVPPQSGLSQVKDRRPILQIHTYLIKPVFMNNGRSAFQGWVVLFRAQLWDDGLCSSAVSMIIIQDARFSAQWEDPVMDWLFFWERTSSTAFRPAHSYGIVPVIRHGKDQ